MRHLAVLAFVLAAAMIEALAVSAALAVGS